jgi:hypothetical protein
MAGRKMSMTLPTGKTVSGTEVAVDESIEKWSEIKFDDGTRIKVKMTVISALRADDEYDQEGNPMYSLNMAPVIAVIEVPPTLKKKVQ